MYDPLFMLGTGILAGNQRSPVYQNPIQMGVRNMQMGMQARNQRDQLAMQKDLFGMKKSEAEEKARLAKIAQIEKQKKEAQINQLISSLSPELQVIARANPEAFIKQMVENQFPEDKETSAMTNAAALGLQPGTPAYNQYIRDATLKPQNQTTIKMPETEKYLETSDLKHYVNAKGEHPKMIDTPSNLAKMGFYFDGNLDVQKHFDKEWAEKAQMFDSVDGSLDVYLDVFSKTGTQILPNEKQFELQSAYTEVQMQLKDLYELGVLAGPDLDLITNVAADPTSFKAAYVEKYGPGALEKQIKLIKNKISRERNIARKYYKQDKPDNQPLSQSEQEELEALKREFGR